MWERARASQPLVHVTEPVALECKQVCKVVGEGLGREPAAPRLFCSKCFWPLRRSWVSEQGTRRPPGVGWGFRHNSTTQRPASQAQLDLGGWDRALAACGSWTLGGGGEGWTVAARRLCACVEGGWPHWCFPGSRFYQSDPWCLFASLPSTPRFGSRIAGPNGESESATSRLSCARMALGRSSTGLCSPTTTCTQATHTTTGRPRASRRPLCPPRASLSSTL